VRVRRLVARLGAVRTRATASVLAGVAVGAVAVVAAVAGGATAVVAALAISGAPAAASPTQPGAATLYRDALASTKEWYVHYQSSSTSSKTTLEETGDAGPASGTQLIHMGTGKELTNTAAIDVIGGTTFVKGNASGLEALAGLSATEAAQAAGQWIQFATDNSAFSAVVAGVRSQDLATELALKGPLKLGHASAVDGLKVDAIKGTQTLGHKSVPVVLYVRAKGPHVPVEEDSLNAHGQRTKAEHIAYSSWGETVRPMAPQATISIGHTNSV
jgi:hypothetical protein